MLDSPELLFENRSLRSLLERYHQDAPETGEDAWADRVADFEGLGEDELSRFHGLLLANGWLDVRVASDALDSDGRLRRVYKATREGVRALAHSADIFMSMPR